MQTILGSGGAIGTPLAKELLQYTKSIRLVSRNPKKVNDTDELFPADITDPSQVDRAIEGSEIVYLTVGFAYDIAVWRREWPKLIGKVIESCPTRQYTRCLQPDLEPAYRPYSAYRRTVGRAFWQIDEERSPG
jgi:putative NADH-flavin reductase